MSIQVVQLAGQKRLSMVFDAVMKSNIHNAFVAFITITNKFNACSWYFYSKTNQMHNISNIFYFGTIFYTFRKVSPSNIRSPKLYTYLMLYSQS